MLTAIDVHRKKICNSLFSPVGFVGSCNEYYDYHRDMEHDA
jgi:hypothetical protein